MRSALAQESVRDFFERRPLAGVVLKELQESWLCAGEDRTEILLPLPQALPRLIADLVNDLLPDNLSFGLRKPNVDASPLVSIPICEVRPRLVLNDHVEGVDTHPELQEPLANGQQLDATRLVRICRNLGHDRLGDANQVCRAKAC